MLVFIKRNFIFHIKKFNFINKNNVILTHVQCFAFSIKESLNYIFPLIVDRSLTSFFSIMLLILNNFMYTSCIIKKTERLNSVRIATTCRFKTASLVE